MLKRQIALTEVIPREAAVLYFQLKDENLIPLWVQKMTNEQDMRLISG